jgi:hypothetical protein
MRCYYHQDRDAVGLCKSCGKGLCADCQTDLGQGLACKARCEERVRGLIALIEHSVRAAPAAQTLLRLNRRNWVWLGVFVLLMGAVITVLSTVDERIRLVIPLGALLSLFGVGLLVFAWKLPHVPESRGVAEPVAAADGGRDTGSS